jgi:uncharacterized cupredoxin-like copper-binding protein
MSVYSPDEPEQVESDPLAIELTLTRMERGLEDQERRVRAAINGFSIFALIAVLLSLATLIAVAAKLQAKTTRTVTVAAASPAARAPAAALPSTVGASLREFSINPTSTKAAAGKVTFKVRNAGSVTHEFVVLRTDKPAGALLKGARADESGNVGETGDLAPGASKAITVSLKAGHYALICNLPGHYRAGQHSDLTVR